VVYVDSNSTDTSVALARSMGVDVVELDLSVPFTAARARNEGFARLLEIEPDVQRVQFVDGDCEVVDGWLEAAMRALDANPRTAVVCGRRRERYPEASVYNRLCDIEWDTPIGEALACGGDALMRVDALREVGGFNASLIAGEEPELCVRLRAAGHRIERLDVEMTWHDAAMTEFGQWWKRAVRAGFAFGEGSHLHGAPPERHWVKETRRACFWGLALPAVAVGAALPTLGTSLLLLGAYPVSAVRTAKAVAARGRSPTDAALYGLFVTVGKLAEAQGIVRFHRGRIFGNRSRIIEYKGASPSRS
jgi:hypothetical protein